MFAALFIKCLLVAHKQFCPNANRKKNDQWTVSFSDNFPYSSKAINFFQTETLLFICLTAINWRKEKTSERFSFFFTEFGSCKPNQFGSVHENNLPIVEVFVCLNISIFEIEIVDGKLIGELIRWSLQNYGNDVCLLRFNIQKCHVTIIDAVFSVSFHVASSTTQSSYCTI